MKTIEEAAKEYAEREANDFPTGDSRESMNLCEIEDWFKDAFNKGVEFAQQWIPCEEELPEINQNVLICDDPQDDEDVRICYRRKDHWTTDYVWDNCERPAYWRPITLK